MKRTPTHGEDEFKWVYYTRKEERLFKFWGSHAWFPCVSSTFTDFFFCVWNANIFSSTTAEPLLNFLTLHNLLHNLHSAHPLSKSITLSGCSGQTKKKKKCFFDSSHVTETFLFGPKLAPLCFASANSVHTVFLTDSFRHFPSNAVRYEAFECLCALSEHCKCHNNSFSHGDKSVTLVKKKHEESYGERVRVVRKSKPQRRVECTQT